MCNSEKSQTLTAEKKVYIIENSCRRSEVTKQTLGYFRIYFGQDGEWLNSYRITSNLKKAKSFADDWVFGVTDAPNLVEGLGNE